MRLLAAGSLSIACLALPCTVVLPVPLLGWRGGRPLPPAGCCPLLQQHLKIALAVRPLNLLGGLPPTRLLLIVTTAAASLQGRPLLAAAAAAALAAQPHLPLRLPPLALRCSDLCSRCRGVQLQHEPVVRRHCGCAPRSKGRNLPGKPLGVLKHKWRRRCPHPLHHLQQGRLRSTWLAGCRRRRCRRWCCSGLGGYGRPGQGPPRLQALRLPLPRGCAQHRAACRVRRPRCRADGVAQRAQHMLRNQLHVLLQQQGLQLPDDEFRDGCTLRLLRRQRRHPGGACRLLPRRQRQRVGRAPPAVRRSESQRSGARAWPCGSAMRATRVEELAPAWWDAGALVGSQPGC